MQVSLWEVLIYAAVEATRMRGLRGGSCADRKPVFARSGLRAIRSPQSLRCQYMPEAQR